MAKYIYNREIAVKEGYRESAEISKGHFKRPVAIWHRDIIEKKSNNFDKEREKLLNNITKLKAEVPYRSNIDDKSEFIRTGFHYGNFRHNISYPNNSNGMRKTSDPFSYENNISISELINSTSINKKRISCYAEKQNGYMYTLRDISKTNKDSIHEIELDGFYDIVGKEVFINISKKDGVYKVNQILYRIGGLVIKN